MDTGAPPARRTSFPLPRAWSRDALAEIGFRGFTPLLMLKRSDLPPGRGIYVILRAAPEQPPEFLPESLLKVYPVSELELRWVAGAEVVYIGKAESGINSRLGVFKPHRTNHSGGRSIWQLSEASTLLACWIETPDHPSKQVEDDYIEAFEREYGAQPYANVQRPGRAEPSDGEKPREVRRRSGRGREVVFVELE